MALPLKASVWKDIIEHVRVNCPHLARGWFGSLSLYELSGGVLIIRAVNGPQVRYLNEHCRRPFAEAAQAATGRLLGVRFETDGEEEPEKPLSFERLESVLKLSSEYVFDNFITGPCNRLAHAASIAVVEKPGTAYNPLFVHGGVGLGKTHLLQAICHGIKRRVSKLNMMYISCETFTNHFLEAVERGALHQFRYRYRHVDLLVIDDIQFLGERERSQEEFFHTFNTLYQSQRQIVLSADCRPAEIPSLEDRLVSRFNSGLVALVDTPCLETRIAIVRAKAKLRCIDLPDNVAKLIATKVDSNVRELEGALAKLHLLSQTRGGKINEQLAMDALDVAPAGLTIRVSDIINLVVKQYNVKLSEFRSRKRTKSIAFPRQVAMYLARELTPLSLEEIGSYFGGRDHTTVIHAHRLIGAKRAQDPEFDQTLEEFFAKLRNSSRELR